MEMKGRNILLVLGNGWVFHRIRNTPIFCAYVVFRSVMVGMLFSVEMYFNEGLRGWRLLGGESCCHLGLGQFWPVCATSWFTVVFHP